MAKKTTTEQVSIPSYPTEIDPKMESMIATIVQECENKQRDLSPRWDTCKEYYNGNQWIFKKKNYRNDVDSNGNLIWSNTFWKEVVDLSDKLPKKIENIIFPLGEAQTAILRSISPTPRAYSKDMNDAERVDTANKINLLFDAVFNDKFQDESEKSYREAFIKGHGYLCIYRDAAKVKAGKMPFTINYEPAENASADPQVLNWNDASFSIRKYKKRKFQIVQQYPDVADYECLKNKDDSDIIELQDVYVRQSYLHPEGDNDMWERFIRIDGKTIRHNGIQPDGTNTALPVMPVECIRTYQTEGWWGRSDCEMLIQHQNTVNKTRSVGEWNFMMQGMPPAGVDPQAQSMIKLGEPIIEPNKLLPKMPGGRPPIETIDVTKIDQSTIFGIVDNAKRSSENIIGIQETAMGVNPQGVYGNAHFQSINNAMMTRVNAKLTQVKNSIENLAEKILRLTYFHLSAGGKIILYDDINDVEVEITKDMLENYKKYNIIIETVDANMLSPLEKFDRLTSLLQYDKIAEHGDLFILTLDGFMPGYMPRKMVEDIRKRVDLNNEIMTQKLIQQQAEIGLRLAEIELTHLKFQKETEQLMLPPAQPVGEIPPEAQMMGGVPEQSTPMPTEEVPMEQPFIPNTAEGGEMPPEAPQDPMMEQFKSEQIGLLVNSGVPEQDAVALIDQLEMIAREQLPAGSTEEIIKAIQLGLQNIGG